MHFQDFIPIDIFCREHGVDVSVISSFHEFGLLEVTKYQEINCLYVNQIDDAEKLVRLYEELEINMQGIDVVTQLLSKIKQMQDEILYLQNKLKLYES
jgi:hypothetical protein